MAVNKYKPHAFIIPEDDANRQIAVGFELDSRLPARALQIMKPAGGWAAVVETINSVYVPKMRSNPNTRVVGIVDCDNQEDRIAEQLTTFPEDVYDRAFLLGTLQTPEQTKALLGMSFEEIGESLARECFRDDFKIWSHGHFVHIQEEIKRTRDGLRPVLFETQ